MTGGGGFLGGAVVRALLARGDEVVSVARSDYPALRALGVRTVRGDLADTSVALAAADGCDAVVHVAAKAGIWGSAADFERSNVAADDQREVLCNCFYRPIPPRDSPQRIDNLRIEALADCLSRVTPDYRVWCHV